MSTTDEYGSRYGGDPVTGWVGWIIFAAVFMITIGAINIIQGLAALFRDDVYWETVRGNVVTFNVTTWGWFSLIFGILLILVGVLLMQGSTFARVMGILLVSLNLINQFGWASFYPFWAIIVIAIDIVILYALIVHGGELKQV
jgi:vacuolar-type H+-ATPase subunit I/STV1